jgi:hypothetical protein
MELEVVVPKELTHGDDLAFRFIAKPIRVDRVNGTGTNRDQMKGVAARREPGPEDTQTSTPILPFAKEKPSR